MVFIDMPNVHYKRDAGPRRIRWHQLRAAIENLIAGTTRTYAGAYFERKSHLPGYVDKVRPGFLKAGYDFQSYNKSTDILLGSDLWEKTVEAIVAGKFDKLRIVIVSGDEDFARPLGRIFKKFGSALTIEIVVVSWKRILGQELERLATQVVYLNDIHNLEKRENEQFAAASP